MNSHSQAPDYKELLRLELLGRIRKNPAFTMRAFARDLNMSPAFLSQVLNGKRVLSEDRAHHVAERLKWKPERRDLFVDMLRYHTAKDVQAKDYLLKKIGKSKENYNSRYDLAVEHFKVISEWYHFAILELTEVNDYRLTAPSAARRLGIQSFEARMAIDRLIRLGLLEEQNGRLSKSKSNVGIADVPSEAIRAFHRQLLEKAKSAIEQQSPENREFYSITLAINPSRLKRAKALIHKFSHEIMECLQDGPKKTVYQLGVQLFKLEKGKWS